MSLDKILPMFRPSLRSEELNEVKKVFASGWLGMGETVFEFEKKVREFLNAKNFIAVNTGTSAIHLVLDSYGIKQSDEVIVPSLTFCATIQAITLTGARPVFCDINVATLNLNVDDLKTRITRNTKAIICVHYCGNPCDMDSLLQISRDNNILLIEDAAHAFGSSYHGKKIGSFGDVTCFSFDPIKNITTGEGGGIAIGDDDIAEEIKRKRILGIDKDSWHRNHNGKNWFYEVTTQGYRYHMSNINAAIGLVQLKKVDAFIKKKRMIVERYNHSFNTLKEVQTLDMNLKEAAPFAYIIRVPADKQDEAIEYLNTKGICSGIHYIPNHIQPFFAKFKVQLPNTEKILNEILTLPLYYDMKVADVDRVIRNVKNFFK